MYVPRLISALIAVACPLVAATVRVPLAAGPIAGRDLHATVLAFRVGSKDSPITADATVPDGVAVDLLPGVWRIVAQSRDYLSAERVVTVDSADVDVPLTLVPASMIDGRIRQTREARTISSLMITWSPAAPSAEVALPSGSNECAVKKNGEFRCRVPLGRIDYNLHARGFASVFRWSGDVPDKGLHLGDLSFVPGASLVGRVQVTSTAKPPESVHVVMTPVELGVRFGDDAVRIAAARNRTTSVSKRGFFQFDGLAPGRYRVSATAPPLVSHPVDVDIIGAAEAELRESLVLGEAKRIRVHLSPAADGAGRPWVVELASVQEEAQRSNVLAIKEAKEGVCEFSSLLPNVYRVAVRQGSQAQWYSETIDVFDDEDLRITIRSAIVRGIVRLGDHPVRAVLWFGGDRGAIRIPVRTSAKGEYAARVPQLDVWPEIDVVADQPLLRRALSDVKLSSTSDDGTFRLDINLPARAIAGQAVDRRGQPVARIPVNVASVNNGDRIVDVLSDDSGSFTFDGLPAGNYSVHAQDGDRESQIVSVTLNEDDRVQDVRLVVTDNGRMNVHVTTDAGPVIGARVWILPASRNATIVAPTTTDVDGNAEVRFRPDEPQVDIVVAAPALPFTFFRTVARSDTPVEVPLNRIGSPLNLAWTAGAVPGSKIALKHRGAMLPLLLVNQWATSANTATDGDNAILSVASADPGDYLLCDTSAAGNTRGCTAGILTAGVPLTLKLPTKE